MNAFDLLEGLARKTWYRFKYSLDLKISQGEETISDNNLLDIKIIKPSSIRKVNKITKPKESVIGADWQWIIGSNTFGWIEYAVQAKKLTLNKSYSSGAYRGLDKVVNKKDKSTGKIIKEKQINLLKNYATAKGFVPIYCLYNYIEKNQYSPYFNCKLDKDYEQLGCTVTPLRIIEEAIRSNKKTFDAIHKRDETIPWRCLVKCPQILKIYLKNFKQNSTYAKPNDFNIFDNEVLGSVRVYNRTIDSVILSSNFDRINAKRLLVVDIEQDLISMLRVTNLEELL